VAPTGVLSSRQRLSLNRRLRGDRLRLWRWCPIRRSELMNKPEKPPATLASECDAYLSQREIALGESLSTTDFVSLCLAIVGS
jgi:hypothetical protein